MKLNLKRPLAFFDLETTGTNIGVDRIVEISVIKMNPDGSEAVKTWKVNPEMPIPLESSLVHGIYDEDVLHAPVFKAVADDVAVFIADSDLAGYNSNRFDIPMLMEEFLRVGHGFELDERYFVDVQNIFHQMEQRTLKAAYQFYCGKDIVNAHSAEADTRATMEVLLAQVERYANAEFEDKKGVKSIPVTGNVDELHKFTNLTKPVDFAGRMVFNDAGEECFNFGKHKGKRVEDVFKAEPSYYAWMMQGDFPLYTKRKLEQIYKRFTQKKEQPKPEQKQAAKAEAPVQTAAKPVTPQLPQAQKPAYNPKTNNPERKPFVPRPELKKAEPAKPIDEDMLAALKQKFGK
ncbi:DNA polymerase III subunit epsilon [Mucilaginibacter sp. HMF5004]|uniref:exonuclease domain-containing protein n=1 Tax=Mucilaginibacter rivuli TaxID=2857527 RepID=UPI001C5EFFF7|nr:exonuclease domain-containing protein [Mucilaginibacter rivuli]MBW4889304.1 DNA polymerase III subunit epsilon [Mucilaginibacter rivuli]